MKITRKAGPKLAPIPSNADIWATIRNIIGPIEMVSGKSYAAVCECPGRDKHTTSNGERDAVIYYDGTCPTFKCFHDSCKGIQASVNAQLRSEVGKIQAAMEGTGQFRPQKQAKTLSVAKFPNPLKSFLEACFEPTDAVCYCGTYLREDKDGKETEKPRDGGQCIMTAQELASPGGEAKMEAIYKDAWGWYVKVNPMRFGCIEKSDKNVTAYRHVLVESDGIPKPQQERILRESGLPISAMVDSGGKSIHAWVKVDAKDRQEYNERVKVIYESLPEEYKLDTQNKNPARFSRMAGMFRGDKEQALMDVKIGPTSYMAWREIIENGGEPAPVSLHELYNFDITRDEKNLLGKRWLCKGMVAAWVAPTGIGKSTLMAQAMMNWALGLDFFGIRTAPNLKDEKHEALEDKERLKLKSYVIQRENDLGDLAEQIQGISLGMRLTEEQKKELNTMITYQQVMTHVGASFGPYLEGIIKRHEPDMVWIDPFQNYLGDDLMDNKVIIEWLSGMLCEIAYRHNVLIHLIHHTAKPSRDPKALSRMSATDLAYQGKGASAIADGVREVISINRLKLEDEHAPPTFRMDLCKRRKRAGMVQKTNRDTKFISSHTYIQHSPDKIFWRLCPNPAEENE